MPKNRQKIPFINIPLKDSTVVPLYHQLYQGLREAILAGQLSAKTRLPATRIMAQELHLSRNTVVNAFEQLLAEGYLTGKVGAGTFVAATLPDQTFQPTTLPVKYAEKTAFNSGLSKRGHLLANTIVSPSLQYATRVKQDGLLPFQSGLPAQTEFPVKIWSRLVAKQWQQITPSQFGYVDSAGYQPLREAVCQYLITARGVRCRPEQVIIVNGSQQGLDLAARLLLDADDEVWLEDPCYRGAYAALYGAGAKIVAVPVDEEGINVAAGIELAANARLAYVTPSHQFPLGVTMPLSRRLALLEWARKHDGWIIEDDYDSEFRYTGRPLASLQGLDSEERVIYLGTFSKVLTPALRLGYLVVPMHLTTAFTNARALLDRHSPQIEQAALADFINEGHFSRHLRRMRALYGERQQALIRAIDEKAKDYLKITGNETGMSLMGWLPPQFNDQWVAERGLDMDLILTPLSKYSLNKILPPAIMLGYAAFTPSQLYHGVKKLCQLLKTC